MEKGNRKWKNEKQNNHRRKKTKHVKEIRKYENKIEAVAKNNTETTRWEQKQRSSKMGQ